ncbi:MAG: quinone-dependent dihydroorotate dehydrogenase [Alphaproteobacteria bacterium]|nr:quinone-dependent dihydroorotate dehydrogenase [Alphaproteobacteria bacterium]
MKLFSIVRPVLHRLDPEVAHRLTLRALGSGLFKAEPEPDPAVLAVRVLGLVFPNPVGLAAGFDKDALVVDAMLGIGFGFVEVGSTTPRPQTGNAKPRLFRLVEDRAVVNRLGFNNHGLAASAGRLAGRRSTGIVGANVGANKDSADRIADYVAGYAALAPYASYVVVNVSSPNTPGLRALQSRAALFELLDRLDAARQVAARAGVHPVPILAKIAPDLDPDERAAIAAVALEKKLDGLIVGNTTVAARKGLKSAARDEAGGLSGAPLFAPSLAVLRDMYRLTAGRIPLIGVGGIASAADAYAKIRAGASLVQLYTALVFEGPGLVRRIKRELADLLVRDGLASVADAVGRDAL